ncbi:MAG TPA: helix-turn-helix domain-containing protein [Candidatus Binataceae bacterium]|nr:helix-turn-helix domain-containing protein [Candidatus Binataceae bacterium]
MEYAPGCLSITEVQRAVARAFGLTVHQMLSRARPRRIAQARQAAMYLCRHLADAGWLGRRRLAGSYPRIARAFARDHSSVIHACNAVARRRLYDLELACRLDELACELARSPAPAASIHAA